MSNHSFSILNSQFSISIIVPYYNNAATLPRCLSSLPEGAEVIVVDDGSHQPVPPCAGVRVIHTPHRGAGAARNRGIIEATGDYLWFVDADDWLGGLDGGRTLVCPTEEAPLGGRLKSALQSQCDMFKMGPMQTGRPAKREGVLDHTTYLYRREFLLEHGLRYPEEMPLLEDSVFVLRCLNCNPVIEKDLSIRPYCITSRTTTAGRWNREKRRRFKPAILRFFREFKAFVEVHPEYRKLYNRYAYVYARVWVVKLLPRWEDRRPRLSTDARCPVQPSHNLRDKFAEAVKLAELEAKNRQREAALQDFAEKVYAALGLETIVVKGSSLARYWPEPLHRECVDNDVYFGPDAPRVDEWLRAQGIEVDGKDPRHSSFFWQGFSFENHAYLLYHYGREGGREGGLQSAPSNEPDWKAHLEDRLEGGLQSAPIEVVGQTKVRPPIRTLTPTYEALFVAAHMEHDALFHNLPLRLGQLYDWMFLWPHVDHNELKQIQFNQFPDLLTSYLFPEQKCVSDRALQAFPELYLNSVPWHRKASVRVLRRSWRYIKYHRVYKEIQGTSPFKLFYFNNLKTALRQQCNL